LNDQEERIMVSKGDQQEGRGCQKGGEKGKTWGFSKGNSPTIYLLFNYAGQTLDLTNRDREKRLFQAEEKGTLEDRGGCIVSVIVGSSAAIKKK